MATYNLGRILPRFRGMWDPTTNYDKLDVVYFEGSSFMAISDNINKRPDENESDWVLSAAKGEPGEPGKDGPTYKAGSGISIINNVISSTGSGGEGGETYFSGFGIDIDLASNQINAEVKATFDVSTSWTEIEMTGLDASDIENWDERNVFYYRGKTYYSSGANHNYVLDGTEWKLQLWSGFTDIHGRDIYVDTKGVMHYYAGNIIMIFDDDKNRWKQDTINISNCYGRFMVNGLDGYDYYFENSNKMYFHAPDGTSTWTKFNGGAYNFDAEYIWSDENTTYYSSGAIQYYFDYNRKRWYSMTWRGDAKLPSGHQIWKDASNIYYSNGVATFQLKYGDTWVKLANVANIYGKNIFEDNGNFYHFYNGVAKQLTTGEIHYITRHGDELAPLDKAGAKINEGFGITAVEQADRSITLSTVVSKAMKPSVDNFTEINRIMKGDSPLLPNEVQDIWTDNEMNTYLYTETGWWIWDGTNFVSCDKTANVSFGRHVWKHQGRIFYTLNGSSLEYVNGSWQEISFGIGNDLRTYFNGQMICSVGDIAYAYTQNNSRQYAYISRLRPGSTNWISELSVSQFSVHPWADNSGIFYFGNYKIVNDSVVDSDLRNFNNGLNVWFNSRNQNYYMSMSYGTADCETSYNAVWTGEYERGGTVFEVDGRYICVGDKGCYELKEMKVVDDNDRTLITERDLDIKLGFIDNILKTI